MPLHLLKSNRPTLRMHHDESMMAEPAHSDYPSHPYRDKDKKGCPHRPPAATSAPPDNAAGPRSCLATGACLPAAHGHAARARPRPAACYTSTGNRCRARGHARRRHAPDLAARVRCGRRRTTAPPSACRRLRAATRRLGTLPAPRPEPGRTPTGPRPPPA